MSSWIATKDGLRGYFAGALGTFEYDALPSSDCSARVDVAKFGPVDVFGYDGHGLRAVRRSFRNIKADARDDFLLSLPLTVPIQVRLATGNATVDPGFFIFLSTRRLFDATKQYPLESDRLSRQRSRELLVRVPGPLLRQHVPYLDDCCGCPIAIREGSGRIMRAMFDMALAEGRALSPSGMRSFGNMLLEGVVNATREAPELAGLLSTPRGDVAHEALRTRAREYIERNLSDPELDVRQVANHCRVSLRHLHAVFDVSSNTIGALIRQTRLEQCRVALRSPALRDKTILEIAMRWGFSNAATFCRSYRSQFGVSPSVDRR